VVPHGQGAQQSDEKGRSETNSNTAAIAANTTDVALKGAVALVCLVGLAELAYLTGLLKRGNDWPP